MILLRGVTFAFFLLVALGLVAWQIAHLREDVLTAASPEAMWAAIFGGVAIVLAQLGALRLIRRWDNLWLLAATGALLLPLSLLIGGLISLIQARGGQHRRNWEGVLTVGALLSVNVVLPMLVGNLLAGPAGLQAGLTAVKVIFFLVVNYFLGRAILHYFASGASAFVSLRYLRRRVISLLSVFGIGLGVLALILVNSVMNGFQRDLREQLRGSYSHLLLRVQSETVDARLDEAAARESAWAAWVDRIEEDPRTREAWLAALDDAILLLRTEQADDQEAEQGRGWPMLPGDEEPARDELTSQEQELIQRLRSGRDLGPFDRRLLRDNDLITHPRDFYLRRVADADTPEGRRLIQEIENQVRRDWYSPLFRSQLQREFDRIESVLKEHRNPQGRQDIQAVSWRVDTKVLFTPRSGSRDLQVAELVAVDVEREPEISNLGRYVSEAETARFRQQYVLMPLANLLGASLGWERLEDDAPGLLPPFRFTADGAHTGFVPADLSRYLARRNLLQSPDKIRWSEFDRVEFLDSSPGQRLYHCVRQAYRLASRTNDLDRLHRILTACERDVRAMLEPLALGPEPSELYEQVNRVGARIILFEYISAIGPSARAIRDHYQEAQALLRHFHDDSDELSEAERRLLVRLWQNLAQISEAARGATEDLSLTEPQREELILRFAQDFSTAIEQHARQAETENLPNARTLLRSMLATQPEPQRLLPVQQRLRSRAPPPMGAALQLYQAGAQAAARRMEAYSRVLPLRTTMLEDDSIEDYIARATEPGRRPAPDRPGVILGDALAEAAIGAGATIGDSISLMIPLRYFDSDNRLRAETTEVWFEITGFFKSGLWEENRSRIYCDFEELAAMLADSDTDFTVGARVADYSLYEGPVRGDRLKADLREALFKAGMPRVRVNVWEDESRTLIDAVNTERRLIGLIISFIIALTGGVIFILVYQLVNEKVKDIGILKALGYSPWGVRSVFMFNALFIGLFGAAAGGAAGMLASEHLPVIEDLIDDWFGLRLFNPEVYFLTHIPSIKGWPLLMMTLEIVAPVVLFSFLCGIYPAQLAARKDPVEALHYE